MSRRAGRRRAGSRLLVVVVVALSVVASACLGPDAFDPTGTAPIGHLDAVFADGDGIRVRGWVADPNTSAPIQLSMSSEQVLRKEVADDPRPDVAAAFPALGPNHGFDVRYPGLAPGRRQICVWAENVGPGTQGRLLGCDWVVVPSVQPAGNLEAAWSPAPGVARVTGWVVEPELPGPAEVTLTVDGQFAARRRADLNRPELGLFFRRDPRLGFSLDLPLPPGRHRICALAVNVGYGSHAAAGCRDVDVLAEPPDRRPSGQVTSVVPLAGGVRVSGVAADPDGPPTQVRIVREGGPGVTVPVVGGSFTGDLTGLPPGPVRVCVTVLDVASGVGGITGDRALPCSSAVVGGTVSVGTGGAPTSSTQVGPPPGSPLTGIDRDAGVSTRLRDGSVLWLFGDSSAVDVNGDLRFFVNNTAAWAAPGSLAATRDAVAAGARPVQFATPVGGFPACPPGRPNRAMWPMSAVTRPDGAVDRVTVFMSNVCLGSGFLEITPVGTSVVEWVYDPASPPDGRPIVGTVTNQQLFPVAGNVIWGAAAVQASDGYLYAYGCQGPPDGGWPDQYGPCRVARVLPGSAADGAAWRFWAGGSSWSPDVGAAVAMTLPDGVDGYGVPVSSLSISRDPVHDVYVMAYSPWPGFTDRIHVRVATTPTGAWTAPVEVRLPGCNDTVAGVSYYCYAGTSQPAFSAPGLLGLGYYDQLVQVGPSTGAYLAVTVPFTVVVSP